MPACLSACACLHTCQAYASKIRAIRYITRPFQNNWNEWCSKVLMQPHVISHSVKERASDLYQQRTAASCEGGIMGRSRKSLRPAHGSRERSQQPAHGRRKTVYYYTLYNPECLSKTIMIANMSKGCVPRVIFLRVEFTRSDLKPTRLAHAHHHASQVATAAANQMRMCKPGGFKTDLVNSTRKNMTRGTQPLLILAIIIVFDKHSGLYNV